ncbi:MAG: FTR1 family iron permease [Lachnospiraceae bacterium]|nr:FTR1 family iron permease [Lachnospiraceae bacterium]
MRRGYRKSKKILTLIMAVFLSMVSVPIPVLAAMASTWSEYADASGISNPSWNEVADAIESVLDEAVTAYQNGNAEEALELISNAKNGYWGPSGLKTEMQKKLPSASKKSAETQFSACNSAVKNDKGTEELEKAVSELKSVLRSAANKLDGVEEEIEIAEETESQATEIFEKQYCSTWEDYQKLSGLSSWTWNDVADAMTEVFRQAKAEYEGGNADAAYSCINDGYYGYYETTGFERNAMGYISGSRKSEVELQFSACKSVAKNNGPVEDFNKEVDVLRSMIRTDANKLDGVDENGEATGDSRSAAVATFIACFTIILREGFEAILVVGAIIAYLLKTSKDSDKKQVNAVYVGALLGILMSFVSAWLLNQLKLANSASQEIIEGVTALIAVVVLYWVSNWMISKSEAEAWDTYIKSRVQKSSDKGSVMALAFTAFLAVFREGAEVILFYQPLIAGDNHKMVWAGFLAGCVCLVFVYLAIRFLSVRIPLKPFFMATSILMFIMSIAFLGSGIKELIEGDVLQMHSPPWVAWIPSNAVLEILGIYPCVETIVPQLILLIITIIVFIFWMKRNKKLKEEAQKARETQKAQDAQSTQTAQKEEEMIQPEGKIGANV